MLILNAPGFFSFSWGIIKKFIDPQTARRIKVFSNPQQSFEALQSLIDLDQIPQDYGGNNKSLQQAFLDEANDPLLLRQHVEVVHVKRKSKAHLKHEWKLAAGEYMEIKCYTRSISGCSVTVSVNGQPHVPSVDNVQCALGAEDGQPEATCHMIVETLQADAAVADSTVSIEIHDNDNADHKKHKGESTGYFLLVGDVKAL